MEFLSGCGLHLPHPLLLELEQKDRKEGGKEGRNARDMKMERWDVGRGPSHRGGTFFENKHLDKSPYWKLTQPEEWYPS